MNKQEWLDRKKANVFSIDVFWEFYQEFDEEKDLTFEQFNQYFMYYVHVVKRVPLKTVVEHYDRKFGITKLTVIKTKELLKEY